MAGREVSVGLAQLWARFDWVRPICALVSIVSLARAGESWLVNGRCSAKEQKILNGSVYGRSSTNATSRTRVRWLRRVKSYSLRTFLPAEF